MLNNPSCDKGVVNIIRNGKSIIDLKTFNGFFEKNIRQIPQYLHFCCRMTHLKYSLKQLGRNFRLQNGLLKFELDHNEVDYNNYKDMKSQWLPYGKQDVLCTAFSYARYINCLEEVTGFSMKDCLTFPGLGWKCFNSLRTEQDEPIYTNNDK